MQLIQCAPPPWDHGDTGKDNEAQQGEEEEQREEEEEEEEQIGEAIQAADNIADMVIAVGSIRPT